MVALLLTVLFLCMAVMMYNGKKEALPSAVEALSDLGDGVQVHQISNGRVFLPNGSRLGLVYVPGALVDSRAYAPLCRDIARRSSCAVVLLDFPLRMAYLGPSRISQAISEVQRLQSISRWVVGGHSLGGTVAIKVLLDQRSKSQNKGDKAAAFFEPELVGVVLHASYNNMGYTRKPLPEDIPVLQVLAENDELISKDNMEKFKSGLPLSKTVIVHIEGGNHAGFGQYGPLPHKLQGKVDGLCTIGLEKQNTQAADATIKFLQERVANKAGYQMVTKADSGYLPS